MKWIKADEVSVSETFYDIRPFKIKIDFCSNRSDKKKYDLVLIDRFTAEKNVQDSYESKEDALKDAEKLKISMTDFTAKRNEVENKYKKVYHKWNNVEDRDSKKQKYHAQLDEIEKEYKELGGYIEDIQI